MVFHKINEMGVGVLAFDLRHVVPPMVKICGCRLKIPALLMLLKPGLCFGADRLAHFVGHLVRLFLGQSLACIAAAWLHRAPS